MSTLHAGGQAFRSECDLIDVTSLHRPDVGWVRVDGAGHVHQWYTVKPDDSRQPAVSYHPSLIYDLPTLVWVKDGEEFWEYDDEPHAVGHMECRQCGEHIEPAYTADTYQQHIQGLRRFYINDELVSKQVFMAELSKRVPGLKETPEVE